jgi:transposase
MAALRKSRAMQDQIWALWAKGYGIRAIARALKIHRDTVRAYLAKADVPDITPSEPSPHSGTEVCPPWHNGVDWEAVRQQHGRGIALKVLWQETYPWVDYLRFWRAFRRRCPTSPEPVLRLQHKPGERAQIDYCDGIGIFDLKTGAKIATQLFVGVLPFSSYTFGEFVLDQKLPSFIRSQQNMFAFFGGMTPYVVPDNLKSGITRAHLYDPDANRTYCEFGNHMGFAVLPARPHTPRDKGAVESAIGIIQETFFARVRDRVFASLFDLNQAFRAYLHELNSTVMKDYGISRLDRFTEERKYLKPLPPSEFAFTEWKSAKVHPDCHIQVGKNFYSVPHQYVGHGVRVRLSAKLIEIFTEDAEPIAAHARLTGEHRYATDNRHYPEAKLATARFDIHQAMIQAKRIGAETEKLVEHLFSLPHPLKYLRRVQGILRLVERKRVSVTALEYACKIALTHKNTRFATIEAIAKHHDRHGPRPVIINASNPKRDEQSLFLHQQRKKS